MAGHRFRRAPPLLLVTLCASLWLGLLSFPAFASPAKGKKQEQQDMQQDDPADEAAETG